MPVYSLTLRGALPSKKNKYKPGRSRIYIDKTAANALVPLQLQAQAAWRHGPLTHPGLVVVFHLSNDAQDTDGAYTAILDVLQSAGVIVNDSIRKFNGPKLIQPAVICRPGEEKTELLFVTEPDDFDSAGVETVGWMQ